MNPPGIHRKEGIAFDEYPAEPFRFFQLMNFFFFDFKMKELTFYQNRKYFQKLNKLTIAQKKNLRLECDNKNGWQNTTEFG